MKSRRGMWSSRSSASSSGLDVGRLLSSRTPSSSSVLFTTSRRIPRPRIRIRLKSLMLWALLVGGTYFAAFHVFPIHINVRSVHFTEHDRCPACFGESLCARIFDGQVELTNWTRFTVSRLANAKNVFHAVLSDEERGTSERIVLKKLAHERELMEVDQRFCSMAGQPKSCRPGHYIKGITQQYTVQGQLERTLNVQKLMSERMENEFLTCAHSQSLIDFLVQRVRYHPESANDENGNPSAVEHIFTLIHSNPEPLAFMAFPQDEGWPFPKYLGACGRLAAFQDAGARLTDFYSSPWETRVNLARQLLDAAFMLSGDNDLNVALYLTDWSPDNLAVDPSDGKLRVVDGEDFIVVDLGLVKEAKGPGSDVSHTSGDVDSCGGHFCYAAADLCTRSQSDHNLFGACAGILAPAGFNSDLMPKGLLHSQPEEVARKHPLLSRLLLECAKPTHPGGRFEAAKEIREILKHL